MKTQKCVFNNSEGNQLAARLDLPLDQDPHSYAVFAHCFTCNKNFFAVRYISTALTQNGFGVLSFDFTGLGESEGDFANSNFSSNIEDLISAMQFMEKEFEAPKLIIGHSLGGAAAIFAGKRYPAIQAVVTIAAPASPQHVQHIFTSNLDEIKLSGIATVDIGGRPFTIKKQFIEDISAKNMQETVKALQKPLLIMHSPQDRTVGIANATEIYDAAMHPKSFISLDGADHLLGNKEDIDFAGNVIASWAARYIDIPKKKMVKSDKQVVVQIGRDNYTTEIFTGRHSLRADEPVRLGGKDYGPAPKELLLASLGACTAITLKMYADRKEWDIEEINVHLNLRKDFPSEIEDKNLAKSKIDILERFIEIKGHVDSGQKNRMLEIANKCPVHKTLHGPVEIITRLYHE